MKKFIKIILASLMISSCGSSYAFTFSETNFNKNQIEVLQFAYQYGKNHTYINSLEEGHLGYIMAAIAWQESGAGLKVQNSAPGHLAFGVFQNYLPTVRTRAKRAGLTMTDLEIKLSLIGDMGQSARWANEELSDWNKYHKGDINKILASYFAGFKYERGKNYANSVLKKANYLKNEARFLNENNLTFKEQNEREQRSKPIEVRHVSISEYVSGLEPIEIFNDRSITRRESFLYCDVGSGN